MATKAELEHANESLREERDRLLEENQGLQRQLEENDAEVARILREAPAGRERRCPVLRAGRAVRRLVTGRATGWTVAAVIAAAAAADELELVELLERVGP